ncbi:uncharacterized protein V6R79_016014 [Siganus canaliculatus]
MPPKRRKSAASSAKGKKNKPPEVEGPGHPDDIFPLLLTSATQELFGCTADRDVTRDEPHKLLSRERIIQDMKTRAAVSDFSPAKQIVLDYPEDELLLVFDRTFTYGQCFYLVVTPEAKERILKPPELPTTEVSEKQTSERTPWVPLGSEREVDQESTKDSREKLRYKLSSVQRRPASVAGFSDQHAAGAECPSFKDSRFSIQLLQRDLGTQVVPRLQSSGAQTQWKFQRNAFTEYVPREFSHEERENMVQSESLRNFLSSVTPRCLQVLQQEELTNVFFDDWKALDTHVGDGDSAKAPESWMHCQVFSDKTLTRNKKVSSISWHPSIHGVIAAALTEETEELPNESSPSYILFFSFSDPSAAQLLLKSPDDISAFEFCPSDPNIVAGGSVSGHVLLWDLSAHVTHLQGEHAGGKKDPSNNRGTQTPMVHCSAVSAVENQHKASTTDVQWLPPTFQVTRTGQPVENQHSVCVQVVTCSADCSVAFWDLRAPKASTLSRTRTTDETALQTRDAVSSSFKHLGKTWKPLFKVSLPKISGCREYVPLRFSLEPYSSSVSSTAEEEEEATTKVVPDYSQLPLPSAETLKADVNTRLLIGTEKGEILCTDWKQEKDESGRLHSTRPLHCSGVHHSPVTVVQRSPFLRDLVLTVGGWSFSVWREGVEEVPVVLSPSSDQAYTAGCWSPSRPAVFFIGKEDGSIEVWNLLKSTGVAFAVVSAVTTAKITCLKAWTISPKQHLLAVGDAQGLVHVLEIPKAHYTPSRSEDVNVRKHLQLEKEAQMDVMKTDGPLKKQRRAEDDGRERTEAGDEDVDLKEFNEALALGEGVLKAVGLWTSVEEGGP